MALGMVNEAGRRVWAGPCAVVAGKQTFSSVETVTGDFSAKLQPLLGPLRL